MPLRDDEGRVVGIVGMGRDITARKRAEEEKDRLQAQLLQAQKMEAIGRLTAGIAHDFNNLLTVINGFAEIARSRLEPDERMKEALGRILGAGQRAADLVKQLLVFSRQQAVEARVLNLNAVIKNMDNMLARVIGEDILLEMALAPDAWRVTADPTHIEQVIMNLPVNARDATPTGGNITVQTANVAFDEDTVAAHPEALPGDYVLLAVSDTGAGMSDEVKAHIFEPFYTTKEHGKGTGLGLATVYGIVEQNGGFIQVHSELDRGATFKTYLPRADDAAAQALPGPERGKAISGGNETVLLVEDEAGVRELAGQVLRSHGYHVLEARDGAEALRVAASYVGRIHLLLTDIVMPGMSGKVLADQLIQARPDLSVLYVSGYSTDIAADRSMFDPGVPFLRKPFAVQELARRVRAQLDMRQ